MRIVSPLLCGLVLASGAVAAAQAPPAKVDIVSVAGCLREQAAGDWRVTNATAAVPSTANAPQPSERPTSPVVGRNQYRLIGVSIFDLPSHKDHTVVVKGLLIKASPMNRLNITSVVTVAPACAPAK